MSEECTHDCSTCMMNCESRQAAEDMEQMAPEDFREPANGLSKIKKVIGVVSGKGGVGKSLVTSMLAVLAQRNEFQAAIMDADITGPSIPKAFGLTQKAESDGVGIFPVTTKTGIRVMSMNLLLDQDTDPVVWRGPVIAGAVKQFWTDVIWGDVDYLFVDMPPGTGDVPLTVFQSLPVDGIIIVATPQELVGMIVEKAVKMAQLMNIPVLGFVENMSYIQCPDCGKEIPVFGQSHAEEIAKKYNVAHVAKLPIDPHLATASDHGLMELFEGDWLDDLANAIFDEQ